MLDKIFENPMNKANELNEDQKKKKLMASRIQLCDEIINKKMDIYEYHDDEKNRWD